MHDYSRLPTLVLNEIFGYLSVKQRVKCKAVCRAWRQEIELRDKKKDTLVLHLGPYLWNQRWAYTNNRGLMKFENSFEMKHLTFLKHPLTRALLKKTRKLAIVNYHSTIDAPSIQPYIAYLDQCEEIEVQSFDLQSLRGGLTFNLPKLKVLVTRLTMVQRIVLNCPSLEVLFINSDRESANTDWRFQEINFQRANKLKRLFCDGWPPLVVSKGRFESLVSLNLFTDHPVDDRLLERMPNLKRLVLYSRNPQADLASIREQQQRYGLRDLEVLPFGCSGAAEIALQGPVLGVLEMDHCIGQLFENYSKLAENFPWKFSVNYSTLFSKFKILPSSFLERFDEPCQLEISNVTNYTHLFGFLRCYPYFHELKLHWSSVKANLILNLVHALQPSLRILIILEEHPSEIDLSFMRIFDIVLFVLESTRLPAEFLRGVAARRGQNFTWFLFCHIKTGHQLRIYLGPGGSPNKPVFVMDARSGRRYKFSSVEELISDMQTDPHLSTLLSV